MFRTIFLFQIICISLFYNSLSIPVKKLWNFELISVATNSSDESRLKFDVRVKRISRGVYGLQGTMYFNFDVVDGDDTMIEATVYRSLTSTSEYKRSPVHMKKQHIHSFLNTVYKDLLMNFVVNCSNLPIFEGKFEPPIEKKTYEVHNCRVADEGLPPSSTAGYYKIIVIGTGQIEYVVETIMKVESAL